MTSKELVRRLKRAGWRIEPGANHNLAISPTGQKIPVPRHRGDLKNGTVKNILKYAGLMEDGL